ncbi:uracil nucleotide/cysteinyl leukotriene receptor-like [Danio aesculapii]|uniref:uracil nucleotide/cysteinyl leukotriene receptor-like n=1 Tax=Danio aesculapii TaxID=1142201 RepID=UPI0024BF61AD|nr:uracil nucleotide/cysteinyl leukotriene receptor-like [Danio aesculapii]
MNNSTVNFTTSAASTNSTTQFIVAQQIMEICMHITSFLIGLPTHCYVIWLIVTGTGNGLASEFFNLNYSLSETGNCLNNLFVVLTFWVSGLITLKEFMTGLTITGRPLFQCLMCVERYMAVVHPVTFLKYKPLRYRVICCAVAWIIILGICLVCMLVKPSNTMFYPWFFFIQFLLFFSVQLFCLVAVLGALKQSGPGERKKEENHMKRRAFYLILITTVSMVITYVPLCLTGLYSIVSELFIQAVWLFSVMCYILAGFVQPVLYLHRIGKLSCTCSS